MNTGRNNVVQQNNGQLMWSFSQEFSPQKPSFKNFKTKAVKGGYQSDWKAIPSTLPNITTRNSPVAQRVDQTMPSIPINSTTNTNPNYYFNCLTFHHDNIDSHKKKKRETKKQIKLSTTSVVVDDKDSVSSSSSTNITTVLDVHPLSSSKITKPNNTRKLCRTKISIQELLN
ncbi:hypothetical protein ABK040_002663 [Willaertia magna]